MYAIYFTNTQLHPWNATATDIETAFMECYSDRYRNCIHGMLQRQISKLHSWNATATDIETAFMECYSDRYRNCIHGMLQRQISKLHPWNATATDIETASMECYSDRYRKNAVHRLMFWPQYTYIDLGISL